MMKTAIEIKCPLRHSPNITGNGKNTRGNKITGAKIAAVDSYVIMNASIGGTLSRVKNIIKVVPIGRVGIRDIGIILHISGTTVLKALTSTKYKIKPKQTRYDCLETNEFWTYVGKKKNNLKSLAVNQLIVYWRNLRQLKMRMITGSPYPNTFLPKNSGYPEKLTIYIFHLLTA
ncbi:MAG: hypothetical protein LBB61_05395 [Treponema sp.]|jgi:hypothetical protein|nr:hypothetical protein [Treponema sp.]